MISEHEDDPVVMTKVGHRKRLPEREWSNKFSIAERGSTRTKVVFDGGRQVEMKNNDDDWREKKTENKNRNLNKIIIVLTPFRRRNFI